MKPIILKDISGKEIYINPELVECIEPCMSDTRTHICMNSGNDYKVIGHPHTVASMMCEITARRDIFVSYKDYEND